MVRARFPFQPHFSFKSTSKIAPSFSRLSSVRSGDGWTKGVKLFIQRLMSVEASKRMHFECITCIREGPRRETWHEYFLMFFFSHPIKSGLVYRKILVWIVNEVALRDDELPYFSWCPIFLIGFIFNFSTIFYTINTLSFNIMSKC